MDENTIRVNILLFWRYFTCTYTIITKTKTKMKSLFRTHKFYWYFTGKTDSKKITMNNQVLYEREYNSNLGPCGDSFSDTERECKLSSFFLFFAVQQQKVEYFLIIESCCWISYGKMLFHLCDYLYLKFWRVKIKGWKCLFVFH